MKELGGPAYLAQLTGSGAAIIGARDFAEQIYDLALLRALVGVGREMVEGALDTSDEVDPKGQIENAEAALYRVAEEGERRGLGEELRGGDADGDQMAEKALNSGGGLSGITTGPGDGQRQDRRPAQFSDLIILAGRPGMGKTALATNIAFNAARRWICRTGGRDRAGEARRRRGRLLQPRNVGRPARHPNPRRAIAGSAPNCCAWARSASRISATSPARRPSWRRCRSISTTRRASPSRRCGPGRGG